MNKKTPDLSQVSDLDLGLEVNNRTHAIRRAIAEHAGYRIDPPARAADGQSDYWPTQVWKGAGADEVLFGTADNFVELRELLDRIEAERDGSTW